MRSSRSQRSAGDGIVPVQRGRPPSRSLERSQRAGAALSGKVAGVVARERKRLAPMRGIVSTAGYVPTAACSVPPWRRCFGSGGGKGTRAVASHDEDTTTMGVEAARLALRSAPAAARRPSGSPPPRRPTSTDQRRRRPRRPPPAGRGAGLRLRWGAAVGRRGPPQRPRGCRDRNHPGGAGRPARRSAHLGRQSAGGDAAAAVLVGDDTRAPR